MKKVDNEDDLPRYVDEKEVHKITGRSLPALRADRCKRQGIPYSKFGRSVKYNLQDVLEYMKTHRVRTDNEAF